MRCQRQEELLQLPLLLYSLQRRIENRQQRAWALVLPR